MLTDCPQSEFSKRRQRGTKDVACENVPRRAGEQTGYARMGLGSEGGGKKTSERKISSLKRLLYQSQMQLGRLGTHNDALCIEKKSSTMGNHQQWGGGGGGGGLRGTENIGFLLEIRERFSTPLQLTPRNGRSFLVRKYMPASQPT